jgi:hypothetical protein
MEFQCTGCQTKLQVPDDSQGKKARCPTCGNIVQIPMGQLSTESSPPAAQKPAGNLDEAIVSRSDSPGARQSPDERVRGRERPDRANDDDWEDDDDYRRRRRARRDRPRQDDALATIIPYKNGMALAAYYCGVFGLIPCAGLILGTIALIFGIIGLRRVRERPEMHGTGHAITGIVLGILEIIGNLACVVISVISMAAKR